MRRLATIQKIDKIEPIDGADRIELAHILGWQCVVKKGEFEEGDLCVYFEIDSFLPEKPIYEFLRSSSYKQTNYMGNGFRLRTQKFKGQISQGLALPLGAVLTDYSGMVQTVLMEEIEANPNSMIGRDVTQLLGVKLFEVPETITTGGTTIGMISSIGVPHTNEVRVQSEPDLFKEFEGVPYYITTKMDGSSHSCAITDDGLFHVTGHNYEYRDDGQCGMYNLAKEMNVEQSMRRYMEAFNVKSLIIQGELCSPNIQKNKLGLKEPHWYVFTIISNGDRLGYKDMQFACKYMNLEMVPVEQTGVDITKEYKTIDDLLARAAENKCNAYPGAPEGIVIRPLNPIFSPTIGDYLSMKVINNKYLLKNKD